MASSLRTADPSVNQARPLGALAPETSSIKIKMPPSKNQCGKLKALECAFSHGSTDNVFQSSKSQRNSRHDSSSTHLFGQIAETTKEWVRVLVPLDVLRLACHGLTQYAVQISQYGTVTIHL